jgi:hypothetical protein
MRNGQCGRQLTLWARVTTSRDNGGHESASFTVYFDLPDVV